MQGRTSMTYKVKMAGKMMSIYYSKRIRSSNSIHYEEVGYCVAESREVVGNWKVCFHWPAIFQCSKMKGEIIGVCNRHIALGKTHHYFQIFKKVTSFLNFWRQIFFIHLQKRHHGKLSQSKWEFRANGWRWLTYKET